MGFNPNELWRRNYEASQKRAALKLQAIEHLGGRCVICGYDNAVGLQFHHISPREKDFEISSRMSWTKIQEELKKCALVCANCHFEIHAGYHPQYLVQDEDYWGSWDLGFLQEDAPDGLTD